MCIMTVTLLSSETGGGGVNCQALILFLPWPVGNGKRPEATQCSIAFVPQAPYASTIIGTQPHPSSLQLASVFPARYLWQPNLLLASPASSKTLELSSDVTDRRLAYH